MNSINEILGIRSHTLKEFSLQAQAIKNSLTDKIIFQNIRRLNKLSENIIDEGIKVSEHSVEEVIQKVKTNAETGNFDIGEWSLKELRIISYNLYSLQTNKDYYDYAFRLLQSAWRNLFFNGIAFSLFNSWILFNPLFKADICKFFKDRLLEYNGSNRLYINLKNHLNFIDPIGPTRLTTLLVSKDEDVFQAPNILGYSSSMLSQSYYSDVIVGLYNKTKLSIDRLDTILSIHNHNRTKKLLLANMVEIAEETHDFQYQTLLSSYINRILGDVTLVATWAPFMGATTEEAQKLKHAMDLVNVWFKRRIIETFFEVCVQDRTRKRFWLNNVKYVNTFKIVGSSLIKSRLANDPRIGNMFKSHFIETNSVYSQTSALVLCIGKKVIIEFSDTGALYVYNYGHSKTNFLKSNTKYISSTDSLKTPSISRLIEPTEWGSYYLYEEGRMDHRGYWEDRLGLWMNKIAIPQVENDPIESSDKDGIFTALPIPNAISSISKSQIIESQNEDKSRTVIADVKPTSKDIPNDSTLYTINSKWIYDDVCRVVMNKYGYYLEIINHKYLHFLKPVNQDLKAPHNIWIRKPNKEGWNTISHSSLLEEITVGFLKCDGKRVTYKSYMPLEQDKIFDI